jgi:hypothetical protein
MARRFSASWELILVPCLRGKVPRCARLPLWDRGESRWLTPSLTSAGAGIDLLPFWLISGIELIGRKWPLRKSRAFLARSGFRS